MAKRSVTRRRRKAGPSRRIYALCSVAVAALLIIVNLPGLGVALPEESSTPPSDTVNSSTDLQFADPVLTAPPAQPGQDAVETPAPVGDEYFADAIFIGNSRTEGFLMYSGVKPLRGYAELGLTVNSVFTDLATHIDGQYMPIMEAVRRQPDFAKAYIMLGMNELGWAYKQPYIDGYSKIIDTLREANPDAIIYVQSILPVTKEKSDEGPSMSNGKINLYNERILAMTKELEVYYLDVASAIKNSSGALPSEASPKDGIHFGTATYQKWFDYLRTHTVNE